MGITFECEEAKTSISDLQLFFQDAPDPPSDLVAKDITDSSVHLQWNGVQESSHYILQMCTEDRFTNLDTSSTRPFPEDSSFTTIYEGQQSEFHVKSLAANEQHWFRVRACRNNILSRWCNKTLSVKTREERGFIWDRAASHKEAFITMDDQRVQRSPTSTHWVCAFGNKAFNLKRRYATIKISGDLPYLYVGVAYKGAPLGEAYNNFSVLWRKGSKTPRAASCC
mmetsp:Transcript_2646/g.6295  ORF Transcript_2646/g.6295 Transcript_2646/m.6295 type:complete len:225 (+) Transcript_2646:1837-2511(+)